MTNQATKSPTAPTQEVSPGGKEELPSTIEQADEDGCNPSERRILKARRRIVFKDDEKEESAGSVQQWDMSCSKKTYEPVLPEEVEQAIAMAMEDTNSSKPAA
jgi:hypothetical protein